MRAEWWLAREDGKLEEHLKTLEVDRDHFLSKVSKFRLRYLFSETDLRVYAQGKHGARAMGANIPPNLRTEHLRHVASLLRQHPGLEMGITKESIEIYYAVNDVGVVLGTAGERPANLWAIALKGDDVARAFREDFQKIWTYSIYNRNQVIAFLDFLSTYVVKG